MKNLKQISKLSVFTGLPASLLASATLCSGADGATACAPSQTQPNIVVVLADDLGWTDLGCQGSGYYETPNIDRLAREGMRFTDAYAGAPNCAPSRGCLITGQYTARHGIYTVGSGNRGQSRYRKLVAPPNNVALPKSIPTVAELVGHDKYISGYYGKWHLGETIDTGPAARGFNSAVWWTDTTNFPNRSHYNFLTIPAVDYPQGQYLTDFLTDQGIAFMRQAVELKKPFVLYIAHFAVHVPLEAPPGLIEKYEKKTPAGGHGNPILGAMTEKLDESVGRLMAALDTLGIAENTLVIFTSDNGGVVRTGSRPGDPGHMTDNTPLRAGKGSLYEGGIRVPFIARWKSVIDQGVVSDMPLTFADMTPTILDIAGITAQAGTPIDGKSFAPLLRSSGQFSPGERAIFWHCPGYLEGAKNVSSANRWRSKPGSIIRRGDWKLIESIEDGTVELYNLRNDISEKHNLATEQKELAKELASELHAWRAATHAPMPVPNPEYNP